MDIIVSMQVKVSLPDDETVSIEYLVRMLKDQQIESQVLEHILNAVDEQLVKSFCGEKYSRQTGRYVRAGTSERRLVTTVGSVTL
ncbi:MAG: ISH6 family transposase, partial [Methanoregula sp.]